MSRSGPTSNYILAATMLLAAATGLSHPAQSDEPGIETGARGSGLYTNRHHHEMMRRQDDPCGPDYQRAHELAEEATGLAFEGTYHTNSKDLRTSAEGTKRVFVPENIYVEKEFGGHRAGHDAARRMVPGRSPAAKTVTVEGRLVENEAPNFVRDAPGRDCFGDEK